MGTPTKVLGTREQQQGRDGVDKASAAEPGGEGVGEGCTRGTSGEAALSAMLQNESKALENSDSPHREDQEPAVSPTTEPNKGRGMTRRQRSLMCWENAIEPYIYSQTAPGVLASVIHCNLRNRMTRLGVHLEDGWFHSDGSVETDNPMFWLATRLVATDATEIPEAAEMDRAATWAKDHWDDLLRGMYDTWQDDEQPWDGEDATPLQIRAVVEGQRRRDTIPPDEGKRDFRDVDKSSNQSRQGAQRHGKFLRMDRECAADGAQRDPSSRRGDRLREEAQQSRQRFEGWSNADLARAERQFRVQNLAENIAFMASREYERDRGHEEGIPEDERNRREAHRQQDEQRRNEWIWRVQRESARRRQTDKDFDATKGFPGEGWGRESSRRVSRGMVMQLLWLLGLTGVGVYLFEGQATCRKGYHVHISVDKDEDGLSLFWRRVQEDAQRCRAWRGRLRSISIGSILGRAVWLASSALVTGLCADMCQRRGVGMVVISVMAIQRRQRWLGLLAVLMLLSSNGVSAGGGTEDAEELMFDEFVPAALAAADGVQEMFHQRWHASTVPEHQGIHSPTGSDGRRRPWKRHRRTASEFFTNELQHEASVSSDGDESVSADEQDALALSSDEGESDAVSISSREDGSIRDRLEDLEDEERLRWWSDDDGNEPVCVKDIDARSNVTDRAIAEGQWRSQPCPHGAEGWCWDCPKARVFSDAKALRLAREVNWGTWRRWLEDTGLSARQLGECLSKRPQLQPWLERFKSDEGVATQPSPQEQRDGQSKEGGSRVFRIQNGHGNESEKQRRKLHATIADAVRRGKTPVYVDGGEIKGVKRTGTLGVYFPTEPERSVYSRVPADEFGRETSQRGEIFSILVLLSMRREGESFVIVSDSWNNFQLMTWGLAEWARKGFKRRMCNEGEMFLMSLLRIQGDEYQDEWRWVRSHKGDRGNETVDQLCDLAQDEAPSARSLGVDAESLRVIASLVGIHKKREVKVQRSDRSCYPALRSVGITRAEWCRFGDTVTASLQKLGNPFVWCGKREGESRVERLDRITNTIIDAIWSGQEHVGTYDRWAQNVKDELKDQRKALERRKRTLEQLAHDIKDVDGPSGETPIGRRLAKSMREELVRSPGEVSRRWSVDQAIEKLQEEIAMWQEDADHFDEQLVYTVQDRQRRRRYAAFCNMRYRSMLGDVMEVAKGRRCEVPGVMRVQHYAELYEENDPELCRPKFNVWRRWPVPLPPIPDDRYGPLHQMATPDSVRAEAARKKARAAADPDGIAPKHIVHGGRLLQQWIACLLNVWRYESVDDGPTTARRADLRLIDKGKQGVPLALDVLKGGTWREIMYTSIFRRLAGAVFKPMIETLKAIGAWPKEQQGAHGGARINLYKIKWAIRLAHRFHWPLLILFTDEEGAFPHNSATELEHWLQACGFDEQLIRFKVGLQRGIAFRVEVGDREWSRWIQMTRGHIQGLPDSPMDYMGPSAWRLYQLDMQGLGFHVSESIVISGGVYVDDEFQMYGGYNQTTESTLEMAKKGVAITNLHYDCARRGVSRDPSKLGVVGITWQRREDGQMQYKRPTEWEEQLHLQSAPNAADGTVEQVAVPVLEEDSTYKLLAHQVGVHGIEKESREAERMAIMKVLEALEGLDLPQRASIEVTDWCGQGMAKYHAVTVDPCTVFDKYMDSVMAKHVKKSHKLRPSSSTAHLYARCEHYGLGKESLWALKQWGKVTTLIDLCNDVYMGPLAEYIRELERMDLGVLKVHDGSSWFFDWDLSDNDMLQHLLTRRGKGKDLEFRGLLRIINEYRGKISKGADGRWKFSLQKDSPCANKQTVRGSRSRVTIRAMLRDVFAQTQRQLWASKATNVFRDVKGLHEGLTNAWRKDRTWKSCFASFAVKATCDNLVTPVWQHRMDRSGTTSAACPVPGCSGSWCDARHIMSGCAGIRDRHTIYNWRHNIVLEVLRSTIAKVKRLDLLSFDKAVSEDFIPRSARTSLQDKPDMVLIDRAQRIVWILDVTVAWDAGHVEAEIRKNDKYRWMIEPARRHLEGQATTTDGPTWQIQSQGVVVGALGSIPKATKDNVMLVWPELRIRTVDSMLKQMSKAALEGSHGIWAIFNAITHDRTGQALTFDRRQTKKQTRRQRR